MAKPGSGPNKSIMMASFKFDNNISALFPYINAVAEKAELHKNPDLLRFHYKGTITLGFQQYKLIIIEKE